MKLLGLCPLIQVFDMPRSLAFYRDRLGFAVTEQSPGGDHCDWARLRQGKAELMLNTRYEAKARPARPAAGRVIAHGDTILFIRTASVDSIYALLREQGLRVRKPVVRAYGMKQLYVKDPDGYELCFQCPSA